MKGFVSTIDIGPHSLGIPEIQEAFKHIRQEKDEHKYRNLSAILLVEDSRIDLAVPGHCALEHNPDAAKPLSASVNLALTSL